MNNTKQSTKITRQTYWLSGENEGKFDCVLIDVLDESKDVYCCRASTIDDHEFVLLVKAVAGKRHEQYFAEMIEPYRPISDVTYVKHKSSEASCFRYIVGDHTAESAHPDFFQSVQETINKRSSFTDWAIDNEGRLTKPYKRYRNLY